MKLSNFLFSTTFLLIFLFQASSCKTSSPISSSYKQTIDPLKLSGGSSGMEVIDKQSFLIVYDTKSYKEGTRIAMLKVTADDIRISPIHVSEWDEEGIPSDLESICKIHGKTNEFFIAESGNWEGKIGRIFHIQVDTDKLTAKVLGVAKLPFKHLNNLEIEGDQYEAMACLPYNQEERILIIAERGGSIVNPRGIVRWGVYNLKTQQLKFSAIGLKGIIVDAPGNWTDKSKKRDITDLHIDSLGGIWASASEEEGDFGPFYSVIYKLGQANFLNKDQEFIIYDKFSTWSAVSGFKIEALSGAVKNINSTHSFGTEDENYGGVWRPIFIKK